MAGPGLPSRTSALPRSESAGADSGDGAAAFAVNALPNMSPAASVAKITFGNEWEFIELNFGKLLRDVRAPLGKFGGGNLFVAISHLVAALKEGA